ncbi:MAG: carboxypeptidase-like regulatory domain-containing protein, partial [Acidobacteriota bacterium]
VSRGLWRLFAYLEGERHVTREIEVEGDLRGLDLDFSAGFTVHGIVTVDGEPARNAEVYGRNTDNSTGTGTRTDESGAFALSGLEEGPALIHVNTELPKLEKRQVVDLQGDLELSIDLTTAPFRVRVLDSEGVGLEGAAIFLVSTSDRKVALGESGPEGLLQARRLGELTAADYPWVEARHPVFGTKRIPHAEGETLQIEFTAQETLLATPISASGATPPTAIYWLQRDIDQIRLETRTTGTHELSVSPGSYLLWVSTGAEVGGPLRVEVPGETSVPLEPAGWARLKLGSVGFGGSVLARRGDVRYPERFYTSREGHQPLGPLPPGLWTLELHTYPTDEIVARIEVQILPGETVEIEVP